MYFLIIVHKISTYFFFNDTATTEIYTLSLHDALPIFRTADASRRCPCGGALAGDPVHARFELESAAAADIRGVPRSEEHTSELQSRQYLVCRLLLEKKKNYFLHQ